MYNPKHMQDRQGDPKKMTKKTALTVTKKK
jgi:hypothetical protein